MKSIFKRFTLFSALALVLVGCGGKKEKNYYDFEDANATAKVGAVEKSYAAKSYEERTDILGLLENYAVNSNLTGMTLYENGSYVMYNPRITKGTNTYIPGYGFGILTEGTINSDLAGETTQSWKRYYHTMQADDPKNINYMDDKGSVVGDLQPNVSSGYWETKMNATKDGYVWDNSLAKQKPQPVNLDATTNMATKYKFEVKVGAELVYNTLTAKSNLTKYAGQQVALDDYLTPFKILFDKSIGFARSAENLTGASSIKGTDKYYAATTDGYTDAAWANVGIKTVVEGGKSYLEIEFNNACTPFYAMYYLASSMYAPIPKQFLTDIGGVRNYGKFNDAGLTPIDTFLSTGPFVIETWEKDKTIAFKKNDKIDYGNRYKIAGIHYNVLSASKTDPEATFKEFMAGKLDATSIPKTKLAEFKTDARTTQTVGATTFKLNLNTTTSQTWESLFGEDGSVLQTPTSEYWKVDPAMSNQHFINGLSYSLNRKEFAEARGRTPSANFFGTSYLSDPENGVSYNSTPQHEAAMKTKLAGTDGFGYSLTLAKKSFLEASKQLIAAGHYKAGDTIQIEVAWMEQVDIQNDGLDIETYFEQAFNDCGGGLKLDIVNHAGAVWSDVYYKKMLVGQFDIAIGGISGNTLNPLNFMEVLKSDNSSGFTLNWGVDTSKKDDRLVYDGITWSYDALWKAADTSAVIQDGEIVDPANAYFGAVLSSSKHNADGTRSITIKTASYSDHGISVEIKSVLYGQEGFYGSVKYVLDKNGVITIQLGTVLEELFIGNVDFIIEYVVKLPIEDEEGNITYEEVESRIVISTKVTV